MSSNSGSVEELVVAVADLMRQGCREEAVAAARSAVVQAQSIEGENRVQLISALAALAHALALLSSAASTESFAVLTQAMTLSDQWTGPDDVGRAQFLSNAALTLAALSRIEESISVSYSALVCSDRLQDPGRSLSILRVLANSLVAAQRYEEGLEICARLYGQEEARKGESIEELVASHHLGLCLLRLGQKKRAQFYLERAAELQRALKSSGGRDEFDSLLREAREV